MTVTTPADSTSMLNRTCLDATLDPAALQNELAGFLGDDELYQSIGATRPLLFSPTAVFVSAEQVAGMQSVVESVQSVVDNPAYQNAVLERDSAALITAPQTPGVFLGFDFHLDGQGPRLIEINTNAGGALLNVFLARAQKACCPEMQGMTTGPVALVALEGEFIAMFRQEWRLARGEQALTRIAIVDQTPDSQYLYPEFVLFQALFRRHGIDALIADPAELEIVDGRLMHALGPVDLVYNRLTDFTLEQPEHVVLRSAWRDNLAVITPHPRAHMLYADKRNLILLTDPAWLRNAGVAATAIQSLMHGIAHTRLVEPANADTLWAERKRLFFKPAGGYGSKAVYRGDKLTRRVWEEILTGEYVAQALVPPAERHVRVSKDTDATSLKYDVRCFVYNGKIQLLAARLYQGQVTNFRTPGGGFAPVFYPPTGVSE